MSINSSATLEINISPSATSQLENDSGFLTEENLAEYQKKLVAGEGIYIDDETNTIYSNGGGSGGTSNYLLLTNKPQINSVELVDDVSLDELGIQAKGDYVDETTLTSTLEGYQHTLIPGTNITIIDDVISVEGLSGSSEYNDLNNKPRINSIELVGNKTLTDLGIQAKGDYVNETQLNTVLTNYPTNADVNTAIKDFVTDTELNTVVNDMVSKTIFTNTLSNYATETEMNLTISNATRDFVTDTELNTRLSTYATESDLTAAVSTATRDLVTDTELNDTLDDYQAKLIAGNNITITGNVISSTGSGQGTTEYNNLSNKPQINSVELAGNRTLDDLGIQAKGDFATKSDVYNATINLVTNSKLTTTLDNYPTETELTLAIKDFPTETEMNSAISTATSGLVTTTLFNNTVNDLATKTELNTAINNAPTKSEMNTAISTATSNLVSNNNLTSTLSAYPTKSEMNTAISDFPTDAEMNTAIGMATSELVSNTELATTLEDYQETLIAGDNISIVDNVISSTGSGGSGVTNYTLLTSKPQINFIELVGNKTLDDLGIQEAGDYATKTDVTNSIAGLVTTNQLNSAISDFPTETEMNSAISSATSSAVENLVSNTELATTLEDYQETLIAGDNISIVDNVISSTGSGGSGVTNYTLLSSKPQINFVELIGNKTLDELGIQAKGTYVTSQSLTNTLQNYPTETELNTALQNVISDDELNIILTDYPTKIDLANEIENFPTETEMNSAISTATSGLASTSELNTALEDYQEKLTSGINIKSINEESILGTGNISISELNSIIINSTTYNNSNGTITLNNLVELVNDLVPSENLPKASKTESGTNKMWFENDTLYISTE